jgi:hypothetical protein
MINYLCDLKEDSADCAALRKCGAVNGCPAEAGKCVSSRRDLYKSGVLSDWQIQALSNGEYLTGRQLADVFSTT